MMRQGFQNERESGKRGLIFPIFWVEIIVNLLADSLVSLTEQFLALAPVWSSRDIVLICAETQPATIVYHGSIFHIFRGEEYQ